MDPSAPTSTRAKTPPPAPPPDPRALERELRRLGRQASPPTPEGPHVDEPLLALLRQGDHDDDLADAMLHVGSCADCRARLVEGDVERRSVVVVAIEAPRLSLPRIEKAAEASSARLIGRGEGRWTAVVDADNAERLRGDLESNDTSVVARLAMTSPVDVPREEGLPKSRRTQSLASIPRDLGTGAAEVQAWAQIRRAPRKRPPGSGPGWAILAALAVIAAMVIAYFLAIR